MIKNPDLKGLILSVFISNHKESLASSSFMVLVRLHTVGLDIIKQVLSTKSLGMHLSNYGISLTYTIKEGQVSNLELL